MRKITDYYLNGRFIKRIEKITPENRKFKCILCEYLWETRKKMGDPPKCPRCSSKKIKEYKENIKSKD